MSLPGPARNGVAQLLFLLPVGQRGHLATLIPWLPWTQRTCDKVLPSLVVSTNLRLTFKRISHICAGGYQLESKEWNLHVQGFVFMALQSSLFRDAGSHINLNVCLNFPDVLCSLPKVCRIVRDEWIPDACQDLTMPLGLQKQLAALVTWYTRSGRQLKRLLSARMLEFCIIRPSSQLINFAHIQLFRPSFVPLVAVLSFFATQKRITGHNEARLNKMRWFQNPIYFPNCTELIWSWGTGESK